MNEWNIPSPKQLLDLANGGKTPTLGQVKTHVISSFWSGYNSILELAALYVIYAEMFGIIILILGFITGSSNIKKWGVGSIIVPLCGLGFMYLIVPIVFSVKTKVLP